MISFRFYLVTLVAIFLAVALGVAIGSTFAEPRLIENLRNQIDTVETRLDERVARIDELGSEIDDLETYVEQSAPFAVDRRLDDQRVLVVAEEGTDGDTVERLVGRLRQGGADAAGILWLDPQWASEEQALEVADALAPGETDPTAISLEAWGAVLDAAQPEDESTAPTLPDDTLPDDTVTTSAPDDTATSSVPETTTTAPPTTATTISTSTTISILESTPVSVLEDAGWIRVQTIDAGEPAETEAPVDDVPPTELMVIFVTSPESDFGLGGAVVGGIARHQATEGVPTVVAESWANVGEDEEETPRGSQVVGIREDPELSTLVSTVDDVDLIQGQVAAVLALADLRDGVVGHYGYGSGADRVLPQWLGP